MKFLKKRFKLNNKGGFTGIDLMIAMGIITILVPIVMTIYLNTFYTVSATKKKSITTNKAVEIFEKLELLGYDDVVIGETTVEYTGGNRIVYGIEIPEGYYLKMNVTKYGDENSLNLIKNVNLERKYKVGKHESLQYFSRIIEREKLQTVNRPILGNDKIAVKYVEKNSGDYWKKIDESNNQWYNYESHDWAISTLKNKVIINGDDSLSFTGEPTFYVWIPRYAYKQIDSYSYDVKFLYSTTNKYVELEEVTEEGATKSGSVHVLKDLPEGYTIPSEFTAEGKEISGVWLPNHTDGDSMPNIFNILRRSRFGWMYDPNYLFNPTPDS